MLAAGFVLLVALLAAPGEAWVCSAPGKGSARRRGTGQLLGAGAAAVRAPPAASCAFARALSACLFDLCAATTEYRMRCVLGNPNFSRDSFLGSPLSSLQGCIPGYSTAELRVFGDKLRVTLGQRILEQKSLREGRAEDSTGTQLSPALEKRGPVSEERQQLNDPEEFSSQGNELLGGGLTRRLLKAAVLMRTEEDMAWTVVACRVFRIEDSGFPESESTPLAGCCGLSECCCPPLDLPGDVLTSLPGASVSLPCPAKDLRDNATIHWVATNTHQRWAGVGRRLLLRSVQFSDSGNYSCYVNGHQAGMVRLLVEAPPEEPKLSCWRKSLLGSVVCEWSPRSAPSPTTEAVLWVRKLQTDLMEEFQERCLYSQESRKFFCQLPVPEGDTAIHVVSMCVFNSAGSRISNRETLQISKILKPDPPANIIVTAVAGHPHWLNVTWKDPHSWNSDFYRLHFELRYRAERSETFSTWMIQDSQYQCIIPDAWRGHRHVVQLRAQEEFGIGSWSDWSPEARGTPWSVEQPLRNPQSLCAWGQAERHQKSHSEMQDSASAPLPAFLVAGGSLAFGSLLCVGLILRFKRTWKSRSLQECKPSVHPPYPLGQPRPTIVLVPLLSPPVSPSSLGSDDTLSQSRPDAKDPQSPYDISNRGYFSR
ncbi:LOW QUALITY PROTEIN: interleukin-6 receptor subunit alpha [Erethizon dorsatum]